MQKQSLPDLTGNQLKMIALIAMTADHVGKQLFPRLVFLQIIGRLAFPIYAYLIAEGCHFTRDRKGYLGRMAALAVVCQAVYFLAEGSLYMSVLVTFSISIGLIYLLDAAQNAPSPVRLITAGAGLLTALYLCAFLRIPGSDYAIDYGFIGVMLPVMVYLGKDTKQKLLLTALCLVLLAWSFGGIQWYCLLSLPLLALYNGQRGKPGIKNFFYIYYPAHLVVIYLFSLIL